MRRASAATTRAELTGVTDDLPAAAAEAVASRRRVSRWFVAVMGGSTRRGRRRLYGRVNAIMGGDDIEHGSARPPRPGAPLIRIRSFALMGGVDVWRLPAETRSMSLPECRRAAEALERGGVR